MRCACRPQEVDYPLFARAREVGSCLGWFAPRPAGTLLCAGCFFAGGQPGVATQERRSLHLSTASLHGSCRPLQIWKEHQPHHSVFVSAMEAGGLQVEVSWDGGARLSRAQTVHHAWWG